MSDSWILLKVRSKLGFLKAVLRDTIHAALTSVGQLLGVPWSRPGRAERIPTRP